MFGKPEWFREKAWGWGVHPVTWQGWAYTAVWAVLAIVPYVGFLAMQRYPEGFIWLGAGVAALVWDVKQILDAKHPRPKKDVLYIGDEDDDSVKTSKLDLRLRK